MTQKRTTKEAHPISDLELAREIEADRDQLSMWEDHAVRANVSPGSTTRFAIPFGGAELALLQAAALAEGTTVSAFIRRAALARAQEYASVPAPTGD
jgi:hypothetical protein